MARKPKQGPAPHRRRVVRYHTPDGRRCKSTDPGAIRSEHTTDTYYAKLRGRWVSLETTDLGEAWIALRSGKIGATPRRESLEPHIVAFVETLRQRGVSEQQTGTVASNLRKLASLAGWTQLGHLSPESLLSALDAMRRAGSSAQTRKHYFRHAYQFARWCVPQRLTANPFAGMRAPGTSTDRRHDRRCPTDEEIAALLAYLETAPSRRGMSGPQRSLGYQVSMATGFRADELRSLSRESFDLITGVVSLAASADKRRKAVKQPIPGWLITELSAWFAAGGQTWGSFPASNPGRLLKADLAGAGVPWSVPGPDGPLFFDFHALRVWYITQLASQPGISPKTLMELARHSDPRLTMSVYAKHKTAEGKAAAEQIRRPGKNEGRDSSSRP